MGQGLFYYCSGSAKAIAKSILTNKSCNYCQANNFMGTLCSIALIIKQIKLPLNKRYPELHFVQSVKVLHDVQFAVH